MAAKVKNLIVGIFTLHIPTWLVVILALSLLLRIPSFFEPYSYGDEMIYLTLGEGVRQGVPLYSGLHDNKPPLLYLLAAVGQSLFGFKAILAVWSLLTIIAFWRLSLILFEDNSKLTKIATIIFGLITTIPLLEGNIANAELFMIGPTILGFILVLSKNPSHLRIACAGILFSIATLFKVPAAFDIGAIVFLWVVQLSGNKESLVSFGKKSISLSIGFLIPIFISFAISFFQGSLKDYLIAAFMQNVGYLSSFRPGDVEKSFFVRNGPLLIRVTILMAISLLLYIRRATLSKRFLFVTSWLVLGLFAVTLSERPYPHYLLQGAAPVAFLFAIFLAERSIEQVLTIFPLALFFFVPVYFKFWYYPTSPYYAKFANFSLGFMGKSEYFASFGQNTERNYKVAEFLKTATRRSDRVFIWEDGAAIYALARRLPPIKYTIGYHIKDFSSLTEAARLLTKNKPAYVVVLSDAGDFPQLIKLLSTNYIPISTEEGFDVWKLVGPS